MAETVNRLRVTGLSLLLLLAGCGQKQVPDPLRVSLIGDSQSALRRALMQGLVSFDASGGVEPGLAERWIVTDGGLSYIFRIRDADWSSGRPIRAAEVAVVLRRALLGAAPSPLFANVESVTPMTGQIIEIRLKRPQPDFLALLALPESGIALSGHGTGPYFVHSRRNGVSRLRPLKPRAHAALPDEDAGARDVRIRSETSSLAVARFAGGTLDMVSGGTATDLPFALITKLPASQLKLEPARGLFGLAVARADGPLKNRNLRFALSLALDRSAITSRFGVNDWPLAETVLPPAQSFTPASLESFSLTAKERLAKAQALAGSEPKTLRVYLPKGPGMRAIMATLAANWRPLHVNLVSAERPELADLKLIDEVAPLSSPFWYLDRLGCRKIRPCEEGTDALLSRALTAETAEDRLTFLKQADSAITSAHYFIPIARPLRWSLVRDTVSGWKDSPLAVHPLPDLQAKGR